MLCTAATAEKILVSHALNPVFTNTVDPNRLLTTFQHYIDERKYIKKLEAKFRQLDPLSNIQKESILSRSARLYC